MGFRIAVIGAGHDLGVRQFAGKFGDLFGALIYQHHHQVDTGVVGRDGLRDVLQQRRLAGPWGRDDEAALAATDRGHHVDGASREPIGCGLEDEAFVRVHGLEFLEHRQRDVGVWLAPVDRFQLRQLRSTPALTSFAFYPEAIAQAKLANDFRRDEYVFWRLLEIAFWDSQEAEALAGYFEEAFLVCRWSGRGVIGAAEISLIMIAVMVAVPIAVVVAAPVLVAVASVAPVAPAAPLAVLVVLALVGAIALLGSLGGVVHRSVGKWLELDGVHDCVGNIEI